MARVSFSRLAEADVLEIDRYSEGTWGAARADRYVDGIYDLCDLLARSPGMGRRWRPDQPWARRIEYGSHVIFYRETTDGIAVQRVLHERMLPPGRRPK